MPRPLEPLNKKQIKYYYEKIKTADLQNNKKEVRRLKRLFLCYIKKRDLDISFFKNHKIYKYFNKLKKADSLRKEVRKLKREISKLKKIKIDGTEHSKFTMEIYKKQRIIKMLKEKIKYLDNKKEYMREHREQLKKFGVKSLNTSDKNIDKLINEAEKMLEEYDKKEAEFKRFKKRHDNKTKKMKDTLSILYAILLEEEKEKNT